MFVFPIIYISAFIASIYFLKEKQSKGIFIFILFGLPIYTLSLSISHMYGFTQLVPVMQTFKEITIVGFFVYAFSQLKTNNNWQTLDKIMLAFFCYNLLYVPLPIGGYSFFEKVLAFKSLSFFPLVYFTGRIINNDEIALTKVFHFIALLTIIVAVVLFIEVITYTHIQSISGYAKYNQHFFDQDPSGAYDLSWTFQIENGMKRFASIFSTPLELAAATLVSLAAIAAIVTNNNNSFSFSKLTAVALLSSLFCINLALSRASLASYLIMLYCYAWFTNKKIILKTIHYALILATLGLIFISFDSDFVDFIINSLTFTNASSVGHLIEWANGLDSMIKSPLGIGLGSSGRISAFSGYNVGGENEFIIIGVQTGIIALGLYIAAYIYLIRKTYQIFTTSTGRIRRLALFLLLLKIGMIIPLFTSEAESYIYISYTTWLLSGIFINMVSKENSNNKTEIVHELI